MRQLKVLEREKKICNPESDRNYTRSVVQAIVRQREETVQKDVSVYFI